MKANPISSGLVNLLLCLHCGAFSRFASFGIASALKGFLAHVVMENPARVNNRTCCMMGECNCACMPVQNPFGRVGLFLSAFPVFGSVLSFSFFGFSTSVFPDKTLFWLSVIEGFFCVVILVLCLRVFLLFQFCS